MKRKKFTVLHGRTARYHALMDFLAARVPIIVSVLDYGAKRVSLAAVLHPSGNYEGDLALIRSHYVNAVGKNAARFAA